MTPELQYFARVSDDGLLTGFARQRFAKELKHLFKGQSVEIVVRRKRKHRSSNQNRYYWLVVEMLSDHTGFTKDEIHAILKRKFLLVEKVSERSGVIYEYVRSTTNLSTVEYEVYLDDVRRFAAQDFGIEIPLPNEQLSVL